MNDTVIITNHGLRASQFESANQTEKKNPASLFEKPGWMKN
jgi:hypothetical protein